jgi:hypothetical protein
MLSMKAPPSPLSSRAEPRDLRFGGPLLEMFFDRGSHGPFGPPKRMKNDPQNCHPDRSEAKWRDLLFNMALPEMFFTRASPASHPRTYWELEG